MRKITSLVVLLFVVITANVYAQGFNYQTVLRNSSGKVEANTSVILKFSIRQGTPSGTEVYSESYDVATNGNGVLSVVVGAGTVISGDFASIDWSNGPYYLNVDIDDEDMGTSRLNSVPYANYAKTAETALTADAANTATTATTANSATNADHATAADNATNADYATTSGTATSATSATTATNADHATSADNATYATSAGSATSATSAGTANTAKDLDITNAEAGDVLYYDGSNWVRLAKGSNGQVLSLESGLPAWKDPTGGSATGPEIGETYDGGTIIEIYQNGDVLLAYNTQVLQVVGPNVYPVFNYVTAESLLPSGWHIPTMKEFQAIEANATKLPDGVWLNADDYLLFWTSSTYTSGGNFCYYNGFYSPYPEDSACRLIPVKKVAYN